MNPQISKITKLLRLSRCKGATASEAASAMAKAQQLAADHGINLSEIPDDLTDEGSPITHSSTKIRKGLEERLAAAIVKTHFGVECITISSIGKSHLFIVGMPSQVDLATYVFVYASRIIRGSWAARENKRLRDRESYLRGFAMAISEKVPALTRSEGLIISQESYVQKNLIPSGCKLKSAPSFKSRLSDAAAAAGYQAGKKAALHNALRAPETQGTLAL